MIPSTQICFYLKFLFFPPSKSPKKFTFKTRLHNPKLNPNFHSHNTPFLITFFNPKECYRNTHLILTNLRYFLCDFYKSNLNITPLFNYLSWLKRCYGNVLVWLVFHVILNSFYDSYHQNTYTIDWLIHKVIINY